jgi:phosphate transport system permease protein
MTGRKLIDRGMRGVLFGAALASSAAILLIIGFLFKEGVGTFGQVPLEFGHVLVADPAAGVTTITPAQLRAISEGKITDWSTLGGAPLHIAYLDYDDLDAQDVDTTLVALAARTEGSVASVAGEELTEDPQAAARLARVRVPPVTLWSFLTGASWYPTAEPSPQFGILALILGSLVVTVGSILVALPVGLAGAVYLSEVAHPATRALLKPTIEVLAGIPSVVFGFFGLVVVVPFLQRLFDLSVGETALAGILMLAIMALPTIVTVSEDALAAVPGSYREASLALGATQWQTIVRVTVPAALSGITAATMLGVGRAVGETMTVLMVTGNAAQLPKSLLMPVRTLTATIAAELGEAPQGGEHYRTLFAIGIVLFLITFVINLVADLVSARYRQAE